MPAAHRSAQRVEYLGRYEGLIRLDSITAGEVNPDARCLRIYTRTSSHTTTPDNHAHHVCGLSQIGGYSTTGPSSQYPWSSTVGSGDASYLSGRCHSKPTEAPLLRDGTAGDSPWSGTSLTVFSPAVVENQAKGGSAWRELSRFPPRLGTGRLCANYVRSTLSG